MIMPTLDAPLYATLPLIYLWLCCLSSAVLTCIALWEIRAERRERKA